MEGTSKSSSPSPSCFAAGKKIIVAGAGIAGLSFVVALRKQWLSLPPSLHPPTIVLYERDPKDFGVEREGYTISIRSDANATGLQALRNLGLLDDMLAQSITGVQDNPGSFVLWDKHWNDVLRARVRTPENLPVPGMRIKRSVLRRILLDAVPGDDEIRWGTACSSAAKLASGKIEVRLSNGQTDECDLLVAADGSRSKLRASFRPDDTLDYAGAVCVMGTARFPERDPPPPTHRDWGMYLSGTGIGLFVSPVDEHSALWSLSYLSPTPSEIPRQPLSREQADRVLQNVLDNGKDLTEPFSTLVKATDVATLGMLNTLDKAPFAHTGDAPVVFIGDANHAVSPFAGAGANLALADGWDLAAQLCSSDSSSLAGALAAYDELSMPRARTVRRYSHLAIGLAHCTGWRLAVITFVARVFNWLFMRKR